MTKKNLATGGFTGTGKDPVGNVHEACYVNLPEDFNGSYAGVLNNMTNTYTVIVPKDLEKALGESIMSRVKAAIEEV